MGEYSTQLKCYEGMGQSCLGVDVFHLLVVEIKPAHAFERPPETLLQ
jgi:hypothetical protein